MPGTWNQLPDVVAETYFCHVSAIDEDRKLLVVETRLGSQRYDVKYRHPRGELTIGESMSFDEAMELSNDVVRVLMQRSETLCEARA